jgi:hypothetical protein
VEAEAVVEVPEVPALPRPLLLYSSWTPIAILLKLVRDD